MGRFIKLVIISTLFKGLLMAGEIKPSLRNILDNAPSDTFVAVIVHLKEQADLSGFAKKDYSGKVEYLEWNIGITGGYIENRNTNALSTGIFLSLFFFNYVTINAGLMRNFFASSPNNEQEHYGITGELTLNIKVLSSTKENSKGGLYVGCGTTNLGSPFLFTLKLEIPLLNYYMFGIQYKNTHFFDYLLHTAGFKGYYISITRRM